MAAAGWTEGAHWRWAALLASLAALGGVAIWASNQPLPSLPSSAGEWWAVAGAVAAYFLGIGFRGERLRRFVRQNGGSLGHRDASGSTVVALAVNTVLPFRAGDAARIVLCSQRGGIGLRTSTGLLITERVLDAAVLICLFVVLAYGALHGIDAPGAATVAVPALLLAAAVAATLIVFRPHRKGRLGQISRLIEPAIDAARSLRGRFAAGMAVLTLGIWLSESLTYLAVSGAVGIDISPIEALYIIATAGVFVLVPAGPGYLGTLDAAVVFALGAIGASGKATISYLVTLRFVLFVPVVLVGAILLATRYGGLAEIRAIRKARDA